MDTQLNRHGGPNFEQLPINRPRVPIHNNNRDGAAQQYIPLNAAAYSPNTLNAGSPKQANQKEGNGFFTTPGRGVSGLLTRAKSATFDDVWSQPRLFYNSLLPIEQQFLINAMRFETSKLSSAVVKQNVLVQLNRVSHDIAKRVAVVLNMPVPDPDPTYYHNNRSTHISIFNYTLPTIATLNVGILTSVSSNASLAQAAALKKALTAAGTTPSIVGEILSGNVDATYSSADASAFDGLIITSGAEKVFIDGTSTYFPEARPLQILQSGYRWGKPVGSLGSGSKAFDVAGIQSTPGVYIFNSTNTATFLKHFEGGLKQFKFLDRFPQD